jgi:multiple sugar transport system ATP-binding protein
MPFLSLRQLEKTYADGTKAVRGIDLAVERGQFVVLLGPSGCGKTTTLRMVAGLEIATGGTITLDEADVTTLRPSRRDVGFVFQFYALYPHLSVKDNIAFPLVSMGVDGREIDRAVAETADKLKLTELLRLYPKQLSGGDQQRVSLARAMVRRPRLWLMDEPLGTLDADVRTSLRDFIRATQLESKVTTLYVTHDQEEAMSLADLVVVMEAGQIRQAAPPAEVYDRPADLFVANFVGSPGMNFVKGHLARGESGMRFEAAGLSLAVPGIHPAGPATLGVRPEHVHLDPRGPVEAKVLLDQYLGSHRSLHAEAPFGPLAARCATDDRIPPGGAIRLRFDDRHLNLFNAAGKRV